MHETGEWSEDDLNDHEYPEPDDSDDDDLETVACPHCHREVYEELEQCPHCREYIVRDTRVWAGRSWWWIALALLGIVAVILGSLQF